MNWTPEQDAILKARRGVMSSSLIAGELGVTRNAVIGRAKRLKLEKLSRNAPAQSKPRNVRHYMGPRLVRAKTRKLPACPMPPLNIPYLELQAFHCREIVGQGDDGLPLSCGHPRDRGCVATFCDWHASVNFGINKDKKFTKTTSARFGTWAA